MKKPNKSLRNLNLAIITMFAVSLFFTPGSGRLGSLLLAQVTTDATQVSAALPSSSDAQPVDQTQGSNTNSINSDTQAFLDPSQQLANDEMTKRQQFLQDITDQLQSAQSDYMSVHNNVSDTETKLGGVQEQGVTLQGQIDILNQQIQDTQDITNNVLTQIQDKESQITSVQNDIDIRNIEIENQKNMLADYLKLVYEQQNGMDDTLNKDNAVNIAKLLLSDTSPDEALRELHYFNIMEDTGRQIFDKLQTLITQQESDQTDLENSRNKLEMLYRQLGDQKQALETQQQAKAQLLSETQGQETIYEQLLNESKVEQSQVIEDISSLSDNLKFIQDKIAQLGDKFNPDDFKSVLTGETTSVYQYMKDNPNGDFEPSWPVSPSRGISAYFHDPSYLKAIGVPHEAIDIRTPQGTPIHAPADGVVYKTRDNGYGYSYIILAHSGGFMTVYGHVSDIMCKEGQKILQGQVIGLSGATPGTKGAGLMTTGPHLHFEVLQGGKHVDPLDYLPLAYLPLNSLPQKYLARITGDPTNVPRITDNAVAGTSQEVVQMVEANGNVEDSAGSNTETQSPSQASN